MVPSRRSPVKDLIENGDQFYGRVESIEYKVAESIIKDFESNVKESLKSENIWYYYINILFNNSAKYSENVINLKSKWDLDGEHLAYMEQVKKETASKVSAQTNPTFTPSSPSSIDNVLDEIGRGFKRWYNKIRTWFFIMITKNTYSWIS